MPADRFAVFYRPPAAIDRATASRTLGAIGFGGARPPALDPACPFAAVALRPADGAASVELWQADGEVRYDQCGPVRLARAGAVGFGLLSLDERAGDPFERTVERAYHALFDGLDALGRWAPLRFWNYLPRITADEAGLERYRRFNIGRHEAFAARLRQDRPPAASALGTTDGPAVIAFLAAPEPTLTIENPRQTSAFAYPRQYGPRSPTFSRAGLHRGQSGAALLVSGTASIVGHESLHPGDAAGQLAETLANLRAIEAEGRRAGLEAGRRALKIYVRRPEDVGLIRAGIEAEFGPSGERAYLLAEICRRELLVEIELVATADLS